MPMDPALYELMAEGAPDDEVAVLLRLSDPTTAPANVRLVAQFGNIATCRLRRGDIVAVRSSEPVRSMKAAVGYGVSSDEEEALSADDDSAHANPNAEGRVVDAAARPADSGDEPFAFGEALPMTVQDSDIRRPETAGLPTGKGVVVAHIDWGVDIAHPDFRLPDGRTRLLALWDQRGAAFPDRPNRYGYGRIFDRDDINRALLSGDPYGTLRYHPADFDTLSGTHGTHTLSIAAGNGRCGGPVGIAPDADLCFVNLSTYTAEGPTNLGDSVAYFEAVDFILRTAAAAPLPDLSSDWSGARNADVLEANPSAMGDPPRRSVVINSSVGRTDGPKDGLSLVEQGLDAALRESISVVSVHSGGNYYNRRTHASGMLRPGETHTLRMLVETDRNAPNHSNDLSRRTHSLTQVELWYPGVDRLAVTITAPDGTRFERALGDQQIVLRLPLTGDAQARAIGNLYHRLKDPNNGDNEVALFLYKGAPAGIYEITLYGEDVADGRYHLWIQRNTAGRRAQAEFAARDSQAAYTTGTICNGFRTIAVGAYDAHAWQQGGDVPETGRPLAPFSSSGPTRDGRQKPDLCAPGVQVLAARSCPRDWPGKAAGQAPPLLTRMSGTSMAAPHVTGTIALLFEAASRPLAIEETRRLLLVPTDPPPADAPAAARLRIGSGFLNIEAAVAAARAVSRAVGQPADSSAPAAQESDHAHGATGVLSSTEALQPMNIEPDGAQRHPPILSSTETLQPMNASSATNKSAHDAAEPETTGYDPEYCTAYAAESAQAGEAAATTTRDDPRPAEAEVAGYYPEYYPDDAAESAGANEAAEATTRDQRPAFRHNGSFRHRDYDRSLPFTFMLPLGGSGGITPALSFPVGGANSPFAFALPLTGSPTPPTSPAPSVLAVPVLPVAPVSGAMDAPIVVADAGVNLLDADEFVAAGSDKSVQPFFEWDGSAATTNETFSEPADQTVYADASTDAEAAGNAADESDAAFGERLVGVADALTGDPQARTLPSARLLAAVLAAVGQAQALSPLGPAGGHLPSATELYNAFVHDTSGLRPRHPFRAHYARRFTPVALPGRRLRAADLRPGDLVVRVARGEHWGQVSIVAAPRLLSALELGGAPGGGYAPGGYVPVIEWVPVPRGRDDHFVRRLTGVRGETLPDTLVLRVLRARDGAGGSTAAEGEEPLALGDEQRPRVLARGARGGAVRQLQATLNRYALAEVGAGRMPLDGCPLAEDGHFGAPTARAVRAFQRRAFADDPRQWDGIVGPLTWGKLDALQRPGGGLIPTYAPSDTGVTPPAAPAEAVDPPRAPWAAWAEAPAVATVPAATAPPRVVADWPLGVDLYALNPMDAAGILNLKNRGKVFAIAKSSQGKTADGKFRTYYRWIRDSGMIRGSYHFFSNKRSAGPLRGGSVADQANLVISLVRHLAPGDLAPALDLEDEPRNPATGRAQAVKDGGRYPLDQGLQPGENGYHYRTTAAGRQELLADIQNFLDRLETALGRTPLIYTSHMWSDSDMMRNPQVMSDYPLWTVYHGQRDLNGITIGGWGTNWDFIQYAEQGGNWWRVNPYKEPHINIPGLDFDAYKGTIHGLRGLADLGHTAPHLTRGRHWVAYSEPDGALHLRQFGAGAWQDQPIASTPALPPAAGDPAAAASATDQVIAYRATDDHIYVLSRSAVGPNAGWSLAQTPGAAAWGDPVALALQDGVHIFYWDQLNNQVHLIRTGNVWQAETLNGPATAGTASGSVAAYIHRTALRVIARSGVDGHLLELTVPAGRVAPQDLTAAAESAGSHPPAATYRPSAYAPPGAAARIVFRAVQGHIAQLHRDTLAIENLTVMAGAPPCAGSPSAIFAGTARILFRARNATIYEIFETGGSWTHRPVCTDAAADPTAYIDEGGHPAVSFRALSGGIRVARCMHGTWNCENVT